MKNIYLIMGASGSGKTTIAKKLKELYGYTSVSSYTTRQPRSDGEEGHIFITKSEFDKLTDIVAYTEYDGNFYASTAEQINNNDLYIIDPDGVHNFNNSYHGAKNAVVIYIKTSLTTRMKRLEDRDGFDAALKRIETDIIAFRNAELLADKVVYNDDLSVEEAVRLVGQYIQDCESQNVQ